MSSLLSLLPVILLIRTIILFCLGLTIGAEPLIPLPKSDASIPNISLSQFFER